MQIALISMYKVILSKQALKDLEKLKRAGESYANKAKELIDVVKDNPFMTPPSYEKLVGDLQGFYSRRINKQHRFVYAVLPNDSSLVHNSPANSAISPASEEYFFISRLASRSNSMIVRTLQFSKKFFDWSGLFSSGEDFVEFMDRPP